MWILFMAALHLEENEIVTELCESLGYELCRALYSDPRGDISEIHANRKS